MSEKKEYTAEEVARMIADRAAEVMKKNEISSEYIEEFLAKSKNSAHEIEPGQEPSSEGTEMQASMESAESSEMEDEPLQGESKEKKEDEDDEEEDKEDEYEFKKNESGMHTVQYKKLVKGRMATPQEMAELKRLKADKENKTRMATPEEKKQLKEKKKKVKPSSDHMRPRGVEDLAASEEMDKCGDMVSTKKHESGMHTVEYKILAKKEDRCWDGYEPTPGKEPYSKGSCQKKSEHWSDTTEGAVNKPFGGGKHGSSDQGGRQAELRRLSSQTDQQTHDEKKEKNKKIDKIYHKRKMDYLKNNKPNLPKSEDMDKCGEMTYKSESGMHTVEYKRLVKGYDEKIKQGKRTEFSHSEEDGASKEMSEAQQATSGVKRKASLKDQTKGKAMARDRKNKSRQATAEGKPDYMGLEDRRKKKGSIKDRDTYGGDIHDKEGQGRKKPRKRGDGHIFKSKDMDKCGDMKVVKSEKLYNFLKKNTSDKQ